MTTPGKKNGPLAALAAVEDTLLVSILVGMIFLAFLQILLRNVFGMGLVWIEPLVRQMLLWVTLAGATVATRDHNHITVDIVSRFLPAGRLRAAAAFASDLFAGLVCALLTYSTYLVFLHEYQRPLLGDVIPGLPYWVSLATLPLAFGVMTLRFARFTGLALLRLVRGGEVP